jgi:hypothetical protein
MKNKLAVFLAVGAIISIVAVAFGILPEREATEMFLYTSVGAISFAALIASGSP